MVQVTVFAVSSSVALKKPLPIEEIAGTSSKPRSRAAIRSTAEAGATAIRVRADNKSNERPILLIALLLGVLIGGPCFSTAPSFTLAQQGKHAITDFRVGVRGGG